MTLFVLLWWPATKQQDNTYLTWLLRSMKGGVIVTLNYDNALEIAKGFATTLLLDSGPTPLDRRRHLSAVPGHGETVRLIKLHGSFDWELLDEPGQVRVLAGTEPWNRWDSRRATSIRPPAPGIIFGAGNKLRPDGPYLDLVGEFREALAHAKRLIVIGYSFRDDHVNELLRGWACRSDVNRLLRIGQLHGDAVPDVVAGWVAGNETVTVQVVPGRFADTVVELMRPDAALLR